MAALRRAPSAAAMVGALALLVVAWTMAVPLGSGQDETDHYVRAVAAGHLTLTGRSAHVPAPAAKQASRAAQPSAFEWAIANTRWFHVPNGLAATPQCGFMYLNAKAPIRCHSSRPPRTTTGTTELHSIVGAYPPWPYVVPGLAMRTTNDAGMAYRLGRFAVAALSMLLLGCTIAASWRRDAPALSLVAVAVAVTPLALYFASILNTSGIEIAAALCFTASVYRLLGPPPRPRIAWVACALGGVVLALTRPLGPAFVVFVLLVATVSGGRRRVRDMWRDKRPAMLVAACVSAAVAIALVSERNMPSQPWSWSGARRELGPSLRGVPELLRQSVGIFVADYRLGPLGWLPWALMTSALLGAAWWVGRRDERARLAAVAVACFVAVVLASDVHGQTGGRNYARYIVPLMMPLPFAAGLVLAEHRRRLSTQRIRTLAACVFAGAAIVQLGAWLATARRIAVGTSGPLFFFGHASWSPLGGWVPWSLTAVAGAALLLVVAFLALTEHDAAHDTTVDRRVTGLRSRALAVPSLEELSPR